MAACIGSLRRRIMLSFGIVVFLTYFAVKILGTAGVHYTVLTAAY